jgi:hypothetical protein
LNEIEHFSKLSMSISPDLRLQTRLEVLSHEVVLPLTHRKKGQVHEAELPIGRIAPLFLYKMELLGTLEI